jgi:drug/metabolite transporter (DMT)-like permease
MSLPERASPLARPRPGPAPAWGTHAALVVVQVAFAVGAVEGKLALRPAPGGGGVDPFALAMARMIGATVFFQILTRAGRGLRPLSLGEHARIAGLSVLGIVLNQTLYLIGLRVTTAFAAALLGATIPVFTAALAVAFQVERATARTGVGLALALGGVVWLTGVGSLDVGALVIALNCLSYSLYIVFSKRVIQRVGALTMVAWLFTWGALLLSPLGVPPLLRGMATWDARGWALVGVIVLLPTIVAYYANAWALGRSSPTLVTVYIYLQPLLAALLQWVQLGESIPVRAVVASALILVGVTVVASRRVALRPTARAGPR